MAQTIEDCLAYLAAARESVEELSLAADREDQLKQDESRLKKALDTEKKQMADAVGSTVKKRRDGINSSYDAEINKAQDQLKKARAKREKAKNQGMKERIAEETSELHEYNKELLARMKKPSVLQPLSAALGKGVLQSPDFYCAVLCGTPLWGLYASAPA